MEKYLKIGRKNAMIPLISAIIPTANWPHDLPRALESALTVMPPGEVEVIVVPNDLDESWRGSP